MTRTIGTRYALAATVALLIALSAALAARGMGYPGMWDEQIRQMASADPATRERAIQQFRQMGPAGGLERLRQFWAATTQLAPVKGRQPARLDLTADELARLRDGIDKVAAQRDATTAWLYWYTDMDAARAEAARLAKPILSLRLLGNLTDEYSCANSRFFRTVLYANPDVAAYLRDHYILHWSSERPVPVVTIDFGDGRLVKRTITGNSIHYVLDSAGRVIDAAPGLYAPAEFLRIVQIAHSVAVNSAKLGDAERAQALAVYHQRIAADINNRFAAALPAIGVDAPAVKPDAADAAPRARGKMEIEQPLLVALDPAWAEKLAAELTDDQWGRLAEARLAGGHVLHAASIALMRAQNAQAYDMDPDRFDRTVAKFERMVVIDTMRNELMFRSVIHQWLAAQPERTMPMAALNERVYAELFLTPAADADLGLLPADVYTGHGTGATTSATVTRR